MMIIHYFHTNKLVYRDLKPNNVMIDENKNAIIIDFDRMINLKINSTSSSYTNDFSSVYAAPEVNSGDIKYENDIFSLGQMIYYIMKEDDPINDFGQKTIDFDQEFLLQEMYSNFTNEDSKKRPSISDSILDFYLVYYSIIKLKVIDQYFNEFLQKKYPQEIVNIIMESKFQSSEELLNYLGNIYVDTDIYKSIHFYSLGAKKNDAKSLYDLGKIYDEGKKIPRDIYKANKCYSLAAKQKYVPAILMLQLPYDVGKYVTGYIFKVDYFLPYPQDTTDSMEQFMIAKDYILGKNVKRDIKKAIYFLTLSANQYYSDSLIALGLIYYENQFVPRDYNKAIHYFSLAEKYYQSKIAQLYLGCIYYELDFNSKKIQNVDKAIHFLTISAENHIITKEKLLHQKN